MTEYTLPRWNARLDAHRAHGFSDLIPMVAAHYRLHEAAEAFLGPYNARQRSSKFPYCPPDKETLKQMIPQGRVSDLVYIPFLSSLVRFCELSKGQRGLPTPHPSIIHSIQLPEPAFSLQSGSSGSTMIKIVGINEPVEVRGLRQSETIRFLIVRPRLSKLGTASGTKWEVLLFQNAFGYIPDWTDAMINPKFSGKF